MVFVMIKKGSLPIIEETMGELVGPGFYVVDFDVSSG